MGCQDGFKSAIGLASKLTNISEEQLELDYRAACGRGFFGVEEGPADDEIEADEVEEENNSNECLHLLQSMQAEVQQAHQDVEDHPSQFSEENDPADLRLPDQEDLATLLKEPQENALQKVDPGNLPTTLKDAISRPGDLFNSLFRLAVRLRSVPGGCDSLWIPSPQNLRRAARGLNWHQRLRCTKKSFSVGLHFVRNVFKNAICRKDCLWSVFFLQGGFEGLIHLRFNERLLARLESEKETPQYKSRTGRLQKWRELCSQALSDLKLPETVPERIQILSSV